MDNHLYPQDRGSNKHGLSVTEDNHYRSIYGISWRKDAALKSLLKHKHISYFVRTANGYKMEVMKSSVIAAMDSDQFVWLSEYKPETKSAIVSITSNPEQYQPMLRGYEDLGGMAPELVPSGLLREWQQANA